MRVAFAGNSVPLRRMLLLVILTVGVAGGVGADESPSADPTDAHVFMGVGEGVGVAVGSSRVALHGYGWFRADSLTEVGHETDVEASIPIARLFMIGDLLESKLSFFAQTEFAENKTELLDLSSEWRFSDAARLRIGQFRTPYARAYITPLTNLELPTRGLVVDHFNLGRDTGGMLSGTGAKGLLHYDLALVNGATINSRNGNRDSPSVIGRVELRFGDSTPYDQAPSLALADPRGLTLGFGGAFSRRSIKDASGTSTESLSNAALDLAWMYGRLSMHVEGFWRGASGSPRVANAMGAYGQLGYFVVPRQLEIGGRVGWLTDGPDIQSYEAFMAGYLKASGITLGHHVKLILGYRYDSADPSGPSRRDRHLVRLQQQLFF